MSKYNLSSSKKGKGKKNQNNRMSFDQTRAIMKYTDKHGRLKVKKMSGKQIKDAQSQCTHHYIGKNGKPKSRIVDNGDFTCTCRICGQRFPSKGIDDKEKLKKLVEPITGEIQNLKWVLQAGGGDQKTMDYLARVDRENREFPKIAARIQTTFKRQSQNKKKKNQGYTPQEYGHWISK